MARLTRSIIAGLGLAVLLGGALAGCASSSGSGSNPTTAAPTNSGEEVEVDAAWLDDGRAIGLVSMGSSTCVPEAGEVTLNGSVLEVELVDPPADSACTMDLVPRVTLVTVPEGVDPTQDLEIHVTGEGYYGDTDLDGAAGLSSGGETEYLPTAGWTDIDDTFVLLTWGSSSCVPVITDATATAAAEVTITFETPAANQVCTMDMAPRPQVVTATGLTEDSGVQAILAGDEFKDIKIPVVGSN